jgi:hypothetical protein
LLCEQVRFGASFEQLQTARDKAQIKVMRALGE